MGIHYQFTTDPPCTNYERTWVEYRNEPGVVYQRTVTASDWVERSRETCFCCSCSNDPYFSADLYCRNHGWYGTRACERHNMSGVAGDDGSMPLSVQAHLLKRGEEC